MRRRPPLSSASPPITTLPPSLQAHHHHLLPPLWLRPRWRHPLSYSTRQSLPPTPSLMVLVSILASAPIEVPVSLAAPFDASPCLLFFSSTSSSSPLTPAPLPSPSPPTLTSPSTIPNPHPRRSACFSYSQCLAPAFAPIADSDSSPPPPPALFGIVGEDDVMRDNFDVSGGANDTDLATDKAMRREPGDSSRNSVQIGRFLVSPVSMREYILCLDNEDGIRPPPSTEHGERFEWHALPRIRL